MIVHFATQKKFRFMRSHILSVSVSCIIGDPFLKTFLVANRTKDVPYLFAYALQGIRSYVEIIGLFEVMFYAG